MPVGKCANCDAAVSYLARDCPYCGLPNQPNVVTATAALAAIAVLGLGAYFGASAFLQRGAPQKQATPNVAPTTEQKDDDYGWLLQAMADCDVYAKQYADTLYFLLVPLSQSGKRVTGWDPAPTGRIGPAAQLVSSNDALIGLRNGVFVLYRKPVTLAVKDAATQTVYKWKPSVGVSELKSRESGFESLTVGLQIADDAEVEWGPSLTVVKGTCYWTYPVIGLSARGGTPPAPAAQ